MLSRDNVKGIGKSLEEALRGHRAQDPKARQNPMEKHLSLGHHVANERLRSVDPRERVATWRVSEFVSRSLDGIVALECTKVPY